MAETHRPAPSSFYRWMVLIFISIAMGGNYYSYDSINPLERILIDRLGFSATQFGWLNASYSVAAVLTLLFGGIIIDRVGIRKALMLFSALCLAGAALTAALAKWFRGKELSFAFGVNLLIARLASVAADNSPTWANHAFYPNGP